MRALDGKRLNSEMQPGIGTRFRSAVMYNSSMTRSLTICTSGILLTISDERNQFEWIGREITGELRGE